VFLLEFSHLNLRICLISSWYPSKHRTVSGIFVHEFAKRLKKAGFNVIVIAVKKTRFDENFENFDGVTVFRTSVYFALPFMFQIFLRVRPHIIHIHAPNFFSSFGIVLGKLLRIPIVATVHRVEVMPLRSKILSVLRRIILYLCDEIVAVSNATKQLILKYGINRGDVRVIYNAADEAVFKPRPKEIARQKLNLLQRKKILLYVGALIPRKGCEYLINATYLMLKKREKANIQLIMTGDGPQKGRLTSLVTKLKVEDYVTFTGKIPKNLLYLYYDSADIFLLPSVSEGHSMVLLEAMASGLPIIATNIGGNRETVINGVNGLLVPPRDSDALAQSVLKLLDDEKLRTRFAKNSLKYYHKNFSEKTQMISYYLIYKRLSRI